MAKAKIEMRLFDLGFNFAYHAYVCKIETKDDGKRYLTGEKHGFGTPKKDPEKILQIANDMDVVRVFEYPESNNFPRELPINSQGGSSGFYQPDQKSEVLIKGDLAIVNERWDAAHKAAEALTHRTIAYDLSTYALRGLGALMGVKADIKDDGNPNKGNSNSVCRTFCDVMGFKPKLAEEYTLLGFEKNLLPKTQSCYQDLYHDWENNDNNSIFNITGAEIVHNELA